ncbi:MAG TPA: TIGR03808 family TAT-translocated repetitive protein, partial [Pseudolabrys sp.]|nr:TIGR03808 family TAT-translocated repetitive protein [Pseudolabrys sp.]
GATALAVPVAAEAAAHGVDAARFGVRPGAPDDRSAKLQRAIDHAARSRLPLFLAPGRYRAGGLTLRSGSQIVGVRGATRLVYGRGPALLAGDHAETVTLAGLVLDGGGQQLPPRHGLVHLTDVSGLRITDCTIAGAGGDGMTLLRCDGTISGNTVTDAADNGLFSNDSRGLVITGNTVRGAGNGGIRVWQSGKRHDGSLIADNTIADTQARAGGSGQNGNAINVYRAADVIMRGNHIDGAAFSAIRGNGADNMQILGNNCRNLGEVALYAEFDFEGAVIANNTVQDAEIGIVSTNFNDGGRLAVIQGNLVRDLTATAPQGTSAGIGIAAEADAAVTGNIVENAPGIGISIGAGKYMRDVAVSGNVVRKSGIGIGVSVSAGAGNAVIANNLIAGSSRGAIVGMEWQKAVTGDLSQSGAGRYPRLQISGNKVS